MAASTFILAARRAGAIAVRRPTTFRRTSSPDEEISDCWERVPADERYLLGVELMASREGPSEPFDWLVTISAREYFRDDPLGLELQQRLETALLAVPAVVSAENASWGTWYVAGKVSGEALCRAAATVVDELADRMLLGPSLTRPPT